MAGVSSAFFVDLLITTLGHKVLFIHLRSLEILMELEAVNDEIPTLQSRRNYRVIRMANYRSCCKHLFQVLQIGLAL